jgi:hypothetical protein
VTLRARSFDGPYFESREPLLALPAVQHAGPGAVVGVCRDFRMEKPDGDDNGVRCDVGTGFLIIDEEGAIRRVRIGEVPAEEQARAALALAWMLDDLNLTLLPEDRGPELFAPPEDPGEAAFHEGEDEFNDMLGRAKRFELAAVEQALILSRHALHFSPEARADLIGPGIAERFKVFLPDDLSAHAQLQAIESARRLVHDRSRRHLRQATSEALKSFADELEIRILPQVPGAELTIRPPAPMTSSGPVDLETLRALEE